MLLRQHKVLMDSYSELESQRAQMNQELNSEGQLLNYISSEEDIQRNIQLQLENIRASVKNIIRSFLSNPVAVKTVLAFKREMNAEHEDMIMALNQLRESLFDRLSTMPIEERERGDLAAWLTGQTAQLGATADRLQNELQEAEALRQSSLKTKNDEIRHVQQMIHNLEKFSEDNVRKLKSEAEKQCQSESKASENKQQKLQSEVSALRARLQQSVTQHRDLEFQLRKKKFRLESEVESWITKYDADMGERQTEFEEVERVYKEEKAQLEELEERFKVLEAEYRQIMEERRIAQELRDEQERQHQANLKAALIIQAFWRGFKVRKTVRAKLKKGKGKKSGAGGKKKKK